MPNAHSVCALLVSREHCGRCGSGGQDLLAERGSNGMGNLRPLHEA